MDRLTYQRGSLVELLQGRLQKREAAREAEVQRREERNEETASRIDAAVRAHPQFLVMVCALLRDAGFDPTDEGFAKRVGERFVPPGEPRDPDEHLRKVIRVLESASDETVEILVGDGVYRYL